MKVADVVRTLRQSGHRMTPQRQRIIEILVTEEEPPTAQEIFERVREDYPNISLDTVYRNLGLLTDVGLVHQINLKAGERARFEFVGNARHHHHLICLHCGRFSCLDFCPLGEEITERAAREQGFRVVSHAFELYGYCRDCAAAADRD